MCNEQNTLSPYTQCVLAERQTVHTLTKPRQASTWRGHCWENNKTRPWDRGECLKRADRRRPLEGGDH